MERCHTALRDHVLMTWGLQAIYYVLEPFVFDTVFTVDRVLVRWLVDSPLTECRVSPVSGVRTIK